MTMSDLKNLLQGCTAIMNQIKQALLFFAIYLQGNAKSLFITLFSLLLDSEVK